MIVFLHLVAKTCRPGPNSPYTRQFWVGGRPNVVSPRLISTTPRTDLTKQKHNSYLQAVRIGRPICDIFSATSGPTNF